MYYPIDLDVHSNNIKILIYLQKIILQELHQKTYSTLLHDIIGYMSSFDWQQEADVFQGVIPSATLLTGINQPDHANQFIALIDIIRYVFYFLVCFIDVVVAFITGGYRPHL